MNVTLEQKNESLRRMAAAVAHEFNNYLAAILLDAEMLPKPSAQMEDARAERIVDTAMRASQLTSRLISYIGHSAAESELLDMTDVAYTLVKEARQLLPQKCKLALSLGTDLPSILAEPRQIRQLMVNLICNAAEASSDSQLTIRIATGSKVLSEEKLSEAFPKIPRQPGEYVYFEVMDQGHGIPAELLPVVFDPFFSTRGLGRGLGLATVDGIVRSHGGAMTIESEPFLGTIFRAYFPVHDQK